MAYGLKYTQYVQSGNDIIRLNIYQRDYTGASKEIATLQGLSLEIQGAQGSVYAPIVKTSVTFRMVDAADIAATATAKYGQWEEFYSPDATKYKVEIKKNSTVIWTGYVTPDSWAEDLIYRGSINITARDMIGALSDMEFDMTGATASIAEIVTAALAKCECPMSLSFDRASALKNTDTGTNILDATVMLSTFSGEKWGSVLEKVLESLGLVLRYNGANGMVVTSLKALSTFGTSTSIRPLSRTGHRSLDPACKDITEVYDVEIADFTIPELKDNEVQRGTGTVQCLIPYVITHDTSTHIRIEGDYYGQMPRYQSTLSQKGWVGSLVGAKIYTPSAELISEGGSALAPMYIPGNSTGSDKLTYIEPSVEGPFTITARQAGFILTSDGTEFYQARDFSLEEIRIQITAKAGNTTYYYVGDSTWVTTAPSSPLILAPGEGLTVSKLLNGSDYRIEVVYVKLDGRYEVDDESEWDAAPKNGLYCPISFVLGIPENSTQMTEFKTTTIYDQNNNVHITRTPSIGSANATVAPMFVQNVLAYNGRPLKNEWAWSASDDGFPLAVMIQAQVLVFHAAACSLITGTFDEPGATFAVPGRRYSIYERNCILTSGSYNFATGHIDSAQLRECLTWDYVWGESFEPEYGVVTGSGKGSTNAVSNNGNVGGGTGGSIPSGGGGIKTVGLEMPDAFEVGNSPITGNGGTINVSLAEDYTIPTVTEKTHWNLAYNFFQVVTVDGETCLKLNPDYAGLFAEGFFSANGASSENGGGGASLLRELLDVFGNSTSVLRADGTAAQNGDVFVYNTSKHKWVAISQSSIVPSIDLSEYLKKTEASSTYQTIIDATHKLAASLISGLAAIATSGSYDDLDDAPSTLPNPNALTFGSDSYDGSEAKTITKSSIGLGNVENKSASQILAGLTENMVYAVLSAARKEALDSGVSSDLLYEIDEAIDDLMSRMHTAEIDIDGAQGNIISLQAELERVADIADKMDSLFDYDSSKNMVYVKNGSGDAGSPASRGLFAYGALSGNGASINSEGGGGGGGGDLPHVFLTEAEYEALGIKDPGTLYFTYEE